MSKILLNKNTHNKLTKRCENLEAIFYDNFTHKDLCFRKFELFEFREIYKPIIQRFVKLYPILVYRDNFNKELPIYFMGNVRLIEGLLEEFKSLINLISDEVNNVEPNELIHLNKLRSDYRYGCINFIIQNFDLSPNSDLQKLKIEILHYCNGLNFLRHLKQYYGK